MPEAVSPEDIARLKSNLSDRLWRLNNLYSVLDKRGNKIKFRMNEVQRKLYGDRHYLNVILKARQLGITTFVDLMLLDACIFNSNVRAGIIAHTVDDAETIFRDKVRFAYESLPAAIRSAVTAVQDSAKTLTFSNNSSISVGTSHRGSTLQYLHISEYGKICAKYPEKAREIRSGALNTIAPGQIVYIESTAEGQEGDFYELCKKAQDLFHQRANLTQMDYKFHFFPWFEDPEYNIDPTGIATPSVMARYFDDLKAKHRISLTQTQRAWYIKKAEEQREDMRREYPSTAQEAFEKIIEGAYFAQELLNARKQGRIGAYPFDARYPVNTFWDIGFNDQTCIWLHQLVGASHRFIGFYMNSGEALPHYLTWLTDWKQTRQAMWGKHYLPHDVAKHDWGTGKTPIEIAATLNYRFERVNRPQDKINAINAARLRLSVCSFDEVECAAGIRCLDGYRKDWNEQLGVWRDRPRHDENSHGADAFMTFACGYGEGPMPRANDPYRNRPEPTRNTSWMAA